MQFKTGNKLRSYYIDFNGHPAELGKMSNEIEKLGITHTIKAKQLKKYLKVTIKIKWLADAQKLREFLRKYNLEQF